jgi:hypothetical protein
VVALDPLEEVDAHAFELIGADAPGHGSAGELEVAVDGARVEPAHRQPRAVEAFVPDLAIRRDREGAVQAVRAPAKLRDLPPRGLAVGRLMQHLAFEGQHLVGTENHAPAPAAAHCERLRDGEPAREVLRRARRLKLERALVDARRLRLGRQPG